MDAMVQFGSHPPVAVDPETAEQLIRGEVAPVIADRLLAHGMPRRGLVRFTLTVTTVSGTRVIGPNLCRRAGTLSSARPREQHG